ncbi:hypothetical protein [Nostoc sp. LPT]|uniref:hypothetical protein n=1 Tax=Nostoc sp. LPT TaxID=2815387 RepID=UPI001D8AA5F9|nr:hypothetical protein [Nostoc sp. LPT]MBN4005504.1 hypothetical protein [Nostoc sp. LPT]
MDCNKKVFDGNGNFLYLVITQSIRGCDYATVYHELVISEERQLTLKILPVNTDAPGN